MDRLRREHTLCALSRALGVSRSGYYGWLQRSESRRRREDRELLAEIRSTHGASRGTYGSPRVYAALRSRGVRCSRKRVARLMRSCGLKGRRPRRYRVTTLSSHRFPTAPNRLERQFTVDTLDSVWAGDITYVWTREGWLYLAVIMDLCSRRIVGWAMDDCMPQELTLGALDMALNQRRPPAGLLHHSDRGSQYAAQAYQEALRQRGIEVSMSRKGNCWDNAPVESFFSTLKTELGMPRGDWTRSQARQALFDFIEIFYNRSRAHSSLGYQSPAQFEEALRAA